MLVSGCLVAFANGSNDNFKGVATLYGSGTASYRGALVWATITTLAGSITAVVPSHKSIRKRIGFFPPCSGPRNADVFGIVNGRISSGRTWRGRTGRNARRQSGRAA